MIRKKPAPRLMRGGGRFSEKIMLQQRDAIMIRLHATDHDLAGRRKT
jgi:hypothetical protein